MRWLAQLASDLLHHTLRWAKRWNNRPLPPTPQAKRYREQWERAKAERQRGRRRR